MTPRELEEYIALRATIRERGTARVWLFVVGFVGWAGLVLATAATMAVPAATLLPLLALAALFEATFALHTGVERIGRYLQVFYEGNPEAGERRWEQAAMAFGKDVPKSLPDPIFASFFMLAALANFAPAILAEALPTDLTIVGSVHLMFAYRVLAARRRALGQRAADLTRFEQMKNGAAETH